MIIGIVAFALAAAGASWWFRYTATHRAGQFWGPAGARLIRDAPTVYLIRRQGPGPTTLDAAASVRHEISKARGLTHFRNALLEDRNFDWASQGSDGHSISDFPGKWEVEFSDEDAAQRLSILFTADCRRAAVLDQDHRPQRSVSTEPIAAGLAEVFEEFWSESSRPAG